MLLQMLSKQIELLIQSCPNRLHGEKVRKYDLRKWTKEQDEYLRKHYRYDNITECAEHLGRTRQAIMARACKLKIPSGRFLNKIGIDFESEMSKSNKAIASKYNLTDLQVRKIRYLNNYGTMLEQSERLTLSEIGRLVGKNKSTISKIWVKQLGLNARKYGRRYVMVTVEELFRFMQENPKRWKASDCEDWFFADQEWFNERRERERKQAIQERWGKFYEV